MKEERFELKFLITLTDYYNLKRQINLIMDTDKHAIHDHGYNLSSLYFDDIYDSATHDKADGIEYHRKFRIRDYENQRTRLEYKIKNGNRTIKQYLVVDETLKQAIIDRDYQYLYQHLDSELLELLVIKMKTDDLKPTLYVDYFREAYDFQNGEVRVTFDKEISTYYHNNDISHKVLEPREVVMEVKYRKYIPESIRKIVLKNKYQPIPYSKYLMSWLRLNN